MAPYQPNSILYIVTFSGCNKYPDGPLESKESPLNLSLGISIVQYVSLSNGSPLGIRVWSWGVNPFLIKTAGSNGTVLLRTIENCPALILKTYWSVGFDIPHSKLIPVTASVDDLSPKVNPLILPGWYLNTLLDWR